MKKAVQICILIVLLLSFGATLCVYAGKLPLVSRTSRDARTAGDADRDGSVTLRDAVVIARYLADGWDVSIDENAADVNADKAVDLKDAVLLRRYLAGGWDVVLVWPEDAELPRIAAGETAVERSIFVDPNGDAAVIPAEMTVSAKADEQIIAQGLVVIGADRSEFVWVPTTVTPLATRDFGSYFSGSGSLSGYSDETELNAYQEMIRSVAQYGGFYMGRYEASKGADGLPASRRVTSGEPGQIWVRFSPQDTVAACEALYAQNDTVQGFFPWGINWDTTLQWLIDSGCKAKEEVTSDSTGWGNYSDDTFSAGATGIYTGAWEEAKANNIYDLAGNNWEWTQERYGSNYVMRGGGYNLMGGACPGSRYPAALRDPLPGNNHHPNVTFRVALYVK